ncbi:antibiotic biosynthesis monooxygenase [Streptomyces regensis]|nr:antibiotic biosynthesis monooxygenase [Streptomyces regensis]KOG67421.1 antibiotic biosynthesis monooxygenase [Streptomyces antibioticus]
MTPGHRADSSRTAPLCGIYIVGLADEDDTTVWVTEVWKTRAHHDASPELPEAKAAIGKAMPRLTGEFTRREVSVAGGLGL